MFITYSAARTVSALDLVNLQIKNINFLQKFEPNRVHNIDDNEFFYDYSQFSSISILCD